MAYLNLTRFDANTQQTDCLIIHTDNVNESDISAIEEIWNVKQRVEVRPCEQLHEQINEQISVEKFSNESSCVVIVVLGELIEYQSQIMSQLRNLLKCDQLFSKPKLIIGRVYPPKIQFDAHHVGYFISSEANFISLWTSCEKDECECRFIQILVKQIKEVNGQRPISYIMRTTASGVVALKECHSCPMLTSSLIKDLFIHLDNQE